MSRPLHVLYVLWWEGVTRSGLIRNQVYELLTLLRARHPDIALSLLSGGPFLQARLREQALSHPALRRLARHPEVRNAEDMTALRRNLGAAGIDLILRESLLKPPSIYLRSPVLRLFPLPHLVAFARLTRRLDAGVVHCRSYAAAHLALLTRRTFRRPYRILFDTRGLLPEEGVLFNAFSRDSRSYRAWKRVELALLNESDLVVNVSTTFTDHVRALAPATRMETIFTCTRTGDFLPASPRPTSPRVLTYLGSLANGGWHSADYLGRLFNLFRLAFPQAHLQLISETPARDVAPALAAQGLRPDDYTLTATRTNAETATLLATAPYAALPFRAAGSPEEQLIGQTMLASKTGEYLATGLPILCNRRIGGAGQLINDHDLGLTLDLDTPSPEDLLPRLRALDTRYAATHERCLAAAAHFDTATTADRYATLYRELVAHD